MPNQATATTTKTSSASMESGQSLHPKQDLVEYVKAYARQKPEVAAMWCFGVGFIVGWKLKPW